MTQLGLSHAAAVLLRMQAAGVDVAAEWQALSGAWSELGPCSVAADAAPQCLFHRSLAAHFAGDGAGLEATLEAAQALAASGSAAPGADAAWPYPVVDAAHWALPHSCVSPEDAAEAVAEAEGGTTAMESVDEDVEAFLGRALGSCRPLPLSWSPLSLDPARGLRTPHLARAAQLVLLPAVHGLRAAATVRPAP